MTGSLLAALALLTSPAAARPVIVDTHTQPDVCYAGESFEAWVEVESDLDVAFTWEASDALYDLGGSIDVYDEDGVFLTCPDCPPAQEGDVFTLNVWVSDANGEDSASWDIEITCAEPTTMGSTECSSAPAGGGLLLVALGLVRRRRR